MSTVKMPLTVKFTINIHVVLLMMYFITKNMLINESTQYTNAVIINLTRVPETCSTGHTRSVSHT